MNENINSGTNFGNFDGSQYRVPLAPISNIPPEFMEKIEAPSPTPQRHYRNEYYIEPRLHVIDKSKDMLGEIEKKLSKCRNEFKHTYISSIRNEGIEMLRELNMYQLSDQVSHLHKADALNKNLMCLIDILADKLDESALDHKFRLSVGNKSNEIGKMIGGLTKFENNKKKKTKYNKEKNNGLTHISKNAEQDRLNGVQNVVDLLELNKSDSDN